MKHYLLFLFLLVSPFLAAQSFGEAEIQGNIKVPEGADPKGITVYNKNTGRGSVSSSDGSFTINAKLQDSLYFSALQYKDLLVIIDDQIFKSRVLNVEILEDINELTEVVVRPHDLTGDLNVDTQNIKTENWSLPVMSALAINDYEWEFRPDGQSSVKNAALSGGGGMQYGAKPLALLGSLIGMILPPRKTKKELPATRNLRGSIRLEKRLRSRYDDTFFQEVLDIETTEIANFIRFMDATGFSAELLQEEQELNLIEFMLVHSRKFNRADK